MKEIITDDRKCLLDEQGNIVKFFIKNWDNTYTDRTAIAIDIQERQKQLKENLDLTSEEEKLWNQETNPENMDLKESIIDMYQNPKNQEVCYITANIEENTVGNCMTYDTFQKEYTHSFTDIEKYKSEFYHTLKGSIAYAMKEDKNGLSYQEQAQYDKAEYKDKENELVLYIEKGIFHVEDIPTKYKDNENVATALMKQDPMQLKNLPLSMRNNPKVVGTALKEDYIAMEYAGGIIRNDQEAMLKLQGINGKAYDYRGEELEKDPDFVKESELKNRDISVRKTMQKDKKTSHVLEEKKKEKKKEFSLQLERRL